MKFTKYSSLQEKQFMLRCYLMFLGIVLLLASGGAQNIEALQIQYDSVQHDSSKVRLLFQMADEYRQEKRFVKSLETVGEAEMLNEKLEVKVESAFYNAWDDICLYPLEFGDSIANQVNSRYRTVYFYTNMAWWYRDFDSDFALKWARKALGIAKSKDEIILSSEWLGCILYDKDELEEALNYYDRALRISKEIRDTLKIFQILDGMEDCHVALGDLQTAIKYSNQQLALKDFVKERPVTLYNFLVRRARIKKIQGDYHQSKKLTEKALLLVKDIKFYAELAHFVMGEAHFDLGDYGQALTHYRKGLSLNMSNESVELNNSFWFAIGKAHKSLGALDSAIHYFNLALESSLKYGKDYLVRDVYKEMSLLEFKLQNKEQGIEYGNKLLQYYDLALGKRKGLELDKLEWQSILYQQIESLDSSLHFIERAINKAKVVGRRSMLPEYLLMKTELLEQKGDWKQAKIALEEAVTLTEVSGANHEMAKILYHLGVIERKLENYDKAHAYTKRSETLAKKFHYNTLLINIYQLSAELYGMMDNHELAYHYQGLYINQKDSLISAIQRQKIARYEVGFRVKEKKLENDLLRSEKEKQEALASRRYSINVLLSSLFGLSILTFWVYTQRVRLIAQEKMRRKFTRDVHDEVGGILNNLNIDAKEALENYRDEQFIQKKLNSIVFLGNNAMSSLRSLIWNIEERPKSLQTIAREARQIVIERLEHRQILFSLEIIGFDKEQSLPFEVHNNLLMIYKESIHNAVKHGTKEPIIIQLVYDKNLISLKVCNTVSAWNDGTPFFQRGLKNMQERARNIKGFLKYQKTATLFTLQFSVPVA